MHKLDNQIMEFYLKRLDVSFLWHLTTHYVLITSAEYTVRPTQDDRQEQLDRQSIGASLFQLSEYRPRQYICLRRYFSHWRDKPLIPQVVVDLGSGGIGQLSKLLVEECSVLAWSATSWLTVLYDDPRLCLALCPGVNIAWLAFNTVKPPLDNPEVRHVLALVINNQRLMQSIYYDTIETAASMLPHASQACDSGAKTTEYNPREARVRLKALELENLTLKLWVPTSSQAWNPSPLKTVELIRVNMAQIGVRVTIIPVEGRFQGAQLIDMNHDLTPSGWATDGNGPNSSFWLLLSCTAIASQTNFVHWCSREFDDMPQKAPLSQQLSSWMDVYKKAQQILAHELPILSLASSLCLQAYHYDTKGLVLGPLSNVLFTGVSWEKTEEMKES